MKKMKKVTTELWKVWYIEKYDTKKSVKSKEWNIKWKIKDEKKKWKMKSQKWKVKIRKMKSVSVKCKV